MGREGGSSEAHDTSKLDLLDDALRIIGDLRHKSVRTIDTIHPLISLNRDLNNHLVIPEGRMVAANWVYQAAVVNFAMGITQTPYNASITSHEHMTVFAYIAVINALCKLGIAAFVLIYSGDHLILYSILLMVLAILLRIYYRYYC